MRRPALSTPLASMSVRGRIAVVLGTELAPDLPCGTGNGFADVAEHLRQRVGRRRERILVRLRGRLDVVGPRGRRAVVLTAEVISRQDRAVLLRSGPFLQLRG